MLQRKQRRPAKFYCGAEVCRKQPVALDNVDRPLKRLVVTAFMRFDCFPPHCLPKIPATESSMPQRSNVLGAALRKRRFDPSHPSRSLRAIDGRVTCRVRSICNREDSAARFCGHRQIPPRCRRCLRGPYAGNTRFQSSFRDQQI